jgi:hypothetical protein
MMQLQLEKREADCNTLQSQLQEKSQLEKSLEVKL